MSLSLPRLVVVDAGGPAPRIHEAPPAPLLTHSEARALASRGTESAPEGVEVERCEPLGAGRWAVGRQRGDLAVWRILTAADVDRVGGHGGWLWTSDAWFDPDRPADAALRAPAALPLRHLIRLAAPAAGRSRRTIKALAAIVAGLRTGRPVALVVDPAVLQSTAHPVRWLALALLCVLPPARREALRVCVGPIDPSPEDTDLAFVATPPAGFLGIDAADPPDEGDDLVAYYVRNRLYDDDPEAVEAAAYLFDGAGDRWGDGIAALIRDGVPGVSEVTPELLVEDPERAVRALAARLRAGAPLTEPVLQQLVSLTLATRDPRPWQALWRRPAIQRADAVEALLAEAGRIRPGEGLVEELTSLYPRGAPLDSWLGALLDWLDQGCVPEVIVASIETTLLEWPLAATGPTRASVWVEVVRALVRDGHDEAAANALVRSPLAAEIARDGAGRALVAAWVTIPARFRDPGAMDALVDLLHGAPDGDRAVAELFRHVRGDRDEATTCVRAWVRRAMAAPSPDDPVLGAVRGTELLAAWAHAVFDTGDPTAARHALQRWAPDPTDPLWPAAARTLEHLCSDPRDRFVALGALEPALSGLADVALELAEQAMATAHFPDPEVAALAERLAVLPGADPLWSWLAVVAATPGTWDDETIDATLVAFLQVAQPDSRAAVAAAALLGSAPGWEPLDHARWLVRLSLAPDGALNAHLAAGLLSGIASRTDAPAFLGAMITALLELPSDHPAVLWLIELLVPAGWQGERLARALRSVPAARIPTELLEPWSVLVEAAAEGA